MRDLVTFGLLATHIFQSSIASYLRWPRSAGGWGNGGLGTHCCIHEEEKIEV
jgi:hypothetical protein